MLKFLQRLALDFPNICLQFFLGLLYRQMYRKFEKVVLGHLAHIKPSVFFSRILRSEDLVYNSYFFRTAILRKLFDIRFLYKHCNFSRGCLSVKMPLKPWQGLLCTNQFKTSTSPPGKPRAFDYHLYSWRDWGIWP